MQGDQREQDSGNNEDVQGEEAKKLRPCNDWATQHEVHECTAHEWNTANDRGADAEAPVGVLVEAEHLACECHSEGEQQQEDSDDPGELSRKFVGTEEED